jgi:hypothetical protein
MSGIWRLVLPTFAASSFLRVDEVLCVCRGKLQRLDELLLGQLSRAAFDHDDLPLDAGVHHVEVAEGALRMGRIDNELSVDPAHTDGADRSRERNVANHQCGARPIERQDIGVDLTIRAQEHGDDLRVVKVALWKERAQRTIRQASGEDFLLGGAAFALEVAAWEFTNRGRFSRGSRQ